MQQIGLGLASKIALLAAVLLLQLQEITPQPVVQQWDAVLPVNSSSIAFGDLGQPFRLLAPANLTFPGFRLAGHPALSLENVYVEDQSGLQLQTSNSLNFEDALLMPWLGTIQSDAQVDMNNVRFNISCSNLIKLQELACTQLSEDQLGDLEVTPGTLFVPRWESTRLSARSLTYTCDITQDTQFQSMTCAVAHVSDWAALVSQSRNLQLSALAVHIMMDANISVPFNFTGAVTTDTDNSTGSPATNIDVYRYLRVASAPTLRGTLVYISLGYIQGEGLWRMGANGRLHFERLVFLTLPLGPINKYPMSVLPWGMWNVAMDRCTPVPGMLVLLHCYLITQSEIMDYISYWAGESLSVFPDRKAAAAWYSIDTTCNPPQNRSLISQAITLQDQNTWEVSNATVLGVTLLNCTLTSKLPPGLRHTQPGLQLTKLFTDPYTPFPEISWVASADTLVEVIKTQPTPNVVILTNITIDPSLWPTTPIVLDKDIAFSGWPARTTVIDWQGVSGVVDSGAYQLQLRNMMLMNGGQGKPYRGSHGWATNLTLYQWPVTHLWEGTDLQFQSVSLVVPQSEYNILQQNSGSGNPNSPLFNTRLNSLSWLQTAVFTSNTSTFIPMMVEDGLLGVNVTITSQAVAFPQKDLNVVLSSNTTPQVAQPTKGKSGPGTAQIVIAVVLPAIFVSVFVLGGLAYWLWRRSQKHQQNGSIGKKYGDGGLDEELASHTGTPPTGPPSGTTVFNSRVGLLGHQVDSANRQLSGLTRGQPYTNSFDGHNDFRPAARTGTSTSHGLATGGSELGQGRLTSLSHLSEPSPSQTQSLQSGVGRYSRPEPSNFFNLGPSPFGMASSSAGQGNSRNTGWTGDPWKATNSNFLHMQNSATDSFDNAPAEFDQLLINRMNMSKDLQVAAASEPDVAAQLKSLVARMQRELGDQEVQITSVIGQGGGGVVYQGLWRGLTVAVKSLVFTVLPAQPMSRRQQRAMTEAAICRTLQHPNIVATYAYDLQALTSVRPHSSASTSPDASMGNSRGQGYSGGVSSVPGGLSSTGLELPHIDSLTSAVEYKLYIIQEYCDGGTLRSVIDSGKLHSESHEVGQTGEPLMSHIVQIAAEIAAGMAHVHSRSIVHGDLTPSNVLLRINPQTESRYTAKVADFGLSWKLASGQEHISNARQGTGFYISPEVLHVGIMSKAADVFSFGMLLHEMYHGTPVWRKGRSTLVEAAEAAMKRPGLDQLHWSPNCPDWLKTLVTACLAPDPKARPAFKDIAAQLSRMAEARAQAGANAIAALTSPPVEGLASSELNVSKDPSPVGSLSGAVAALPAGLAEVTPSPPETPLVPKSEPLAIISVQDNSTAPSLGFHTLQPNSCPEVTEIAKKLTSSAPETENFWSQHVGHTLAPAMILVPPKEVGLDAEHLMTGRSTNTEGSPSFGTVQQPAWLLASPATTPPGSPLMPRSTVQPPITTSQSLVTTDSAQAQSLTPASQAGSAASENANLNASVGMANSHTIVTQAQSLPEPAVAGLTDLQAVLKEGSGMLIGPVIGSTSAQSLGPDVQPAPFLLVSAACQPVQKGELALVVETIGSSESLQALSRGSTPRFGPVSNGTAMSIAVISDRQQGSSESLLAEQQLQQPITFRLQRVAEQHQQQQQVVHVQHDTTQETSNLPDGNHTNPMPITVQQQNDVVLEFPHDSLDCDQEDGVRTTPTSPWGGSVCVLSVAGTGGEPIPPVSTPDLLRSSSLAPPASISDTASNSSAMLVTMAGWQLSQEGVGRGSQQTWAGSSGASSTSQSTFSRQQSWWMNGYANNSSAQLETGHGRSHSSHIGSSRHTSSTMRAESSHLNSRSEVHPSPRHTQEHPSPFSIAEEPGKLPPFPIAEERGKLPVVLQPAARHMLGSPSSSALPGAQTTSASGWFIDVLESGKTSGHDSGAMARIGTPIGSPFHQSAVTVNEARKPQLNIIEKAISTVTEPAVNR